MMNEKIAADLPSGWQASSTSDGKVELRVSPRGRGCLIAGASVLAIGWAVFVVSAVSHRSLDNVVVGLVLILFATWCALGKECWHLEKNCMEHVVGIGSWSYTRRFENAELEIIRRLSTKGHPPNFRLYAVVGGKRRFLLERQEEEIQKLELFISSKTGWIVKPIHYDWSTD
jgi:hypothetical protein